MDLSTLSYFMEVSKDLHITNTARRLFISQQRLSGHIQRLEEYYGVPLLERKPKLQLTYAGQLLVEYAGQILNMEQEMKARLQDIAGENTGAIRLGISQVRAQICIPDIMMNFHQKYPQVRLELITAHSVYLQDLAASGDIDLFIGVLPNLSNPDIEMSSLLNERIYMVISDDMLRCVCGNEIKKMKKELKQGVLLQNFADFPLIVPAPTSRLRKILDYIFREIDVKPNIIFESGSSPMLASLSCLGLGISFIPQMMIKQLQDTLTVQEKKEINLFPLDHPSASYQIGIGTLKHRYFPNFLTVFMDITRKIFRTYENLGQE